MNRLREVLVELIGVGDLVGVVNVGGILISGCGLLLAALLLFARGFTFEKFYHSIVITHIQIAISFHALERTAVSRRRSW